MRRRRRARHRTSSVWTIHFEAGKRLLQAQEAAYAYWLMTDCELDDSRALYADRARFDDDANARGLPCLRDIHVMLRPE